MERCNRNGHHFQRSRQRTDFMKPKVAPRLDPQAFVDRRFAMQPVATGTANGTAGAEITTSNCSPNFPPTQQKRHQATDFPQDRRYFCDRCFRGYNTSYYYELHLKNHVQCIADGCKFSGLPRVVAKHLLTFHSYDTSTTPSDSLNSSLNKWIQARKRNFPSKDVIETKRQRTEAQIERGEVLETKNNFGKFRLAPMKEFTSSAQKDDSEDRSESILKSTDKRPEESVLGSTKLLEKLLAKEIQYERNVMLQCIRHIVKNGPAFGINDWGDEKANGTDHPQNRLVDQEVKK